MTGFSFLGYCPFVKNILVVDFICYFILFLWIPFLFLFYCIIVIMICYLLRIMTGFLNAFCFYGFLALPSRRVFVFGSDENGG